MINKEKPLNLFRVGGWLMSSLSLIHIVDYVNLISIYGSLSKWVDVYYFFIKIMGDFLFEWINFKIDLNFIIIRLNVDDNDKHFIVLITLIVSALWKSYFHLSNYKIIYSGIIIAFCFINIAILSIFLIIFENIFVNIIIFAIVSLVYIFLLYSFYGSKRNRMRFNVLITEIKNVLILFIIIILMNYSIFKFI